jgi:hypothetical protein
MAEFSTIAKDDSGIAQADGVPLDRLKALGNEMADALAEYDPELNWHGMVYPSGSRISGLYLVQSLDDTRSDLPPGKPAADTLWDAASTMEDVHLRLETYLRSIALMAEGSEATTTLDLFERCMSELKRLKAAEAEAFAQARALKVEKATIAA